MPRSAREQRREWLAQYHCDNPCAPRAHALAALNREGPRPFRVLYLGERHDQVRDAINLARNNGMLAEHHGGYDRGFDPARFRRTSRMHTTGAPESHRTGGRICARCRVRPSRRRNTMS